MVGTISKDRGKGQLEFGESEIRSLHKYEITMNLQIFNTCLSIDSLVPYMVLFGRVESREGKFVVVDYQLEDQTKGFVDVEEKAIQSIRVDDILPIQIRSIDINNQITRGVIATSSDNQPMVI